MDFYDHLQLTITNNLITNYSYTYKEATKLVNKYQKVIKEVNLDIDSKEWAENLTLAKRDNFTPRKWIKHSKKIDKLIQKSWNG